MACVSHRTDASRRGYYLAPSTAPSADLCGRQAHQGLIPHRGTTMMQSTPTPPPTSARGRVSHALGEAVEASMHALDSGSQLAAGKIGDMAGDLRQSAAD